MSSAPNTCIAPPHGPTIPTLVLREAIIAERDRRGWTDRQLSIASGVAYSRLHEWLSKTTDSKGLTSHSVDKLAATLRLELQPIQTTEFRPQSPPSPRLTDLHRFYRILQFLFKHKVHAG